MSSVSDEVFQQSCSWKTEILQRLDERNKREILILSSIFDSHNRLLRNCESFRSKNATLSLQVDKLKQENIEISIRAESGIVGSGAGHRLQNLQDDLTLALKNKAENAEKIIALSKSLAEKEKEIEQHRENNRRLLAQLQDIQAVNQNLEDNLIQSSATNETISDEHHALQLAYNSMEANCRKLQDENADLIQRWMQQKSRAADTLNEENETALRIKREKVAKDLEEATHEQVKIEDVPYYGPALCIASTVPSRCHYKFAAHDGEVNAAVWVPSGRFLATGGADRKVKTWELSASNKFQQQYVLSSSNATIMCIDFDLEESLLLASSNDFASRIWTLQDQRLRHTLTGHSNKVFAARFLPDKNKTVSGSHDRTLKLWDLTRGGCTKTLFAGSSCNDLIVGDSLTGTIISGHFDKKMRFWDMRSDSSVQEVMLGGRITSLQMSPEKDKILACCKDDSLCIIDVRMNRIIQTFGHDDFHVSCDYGRASFSPNGDFVAAGSRCGSVFVWNVLKKKLEACLLEHSSSVISCGWHPTGSSMISTDKQNNVAYWLDM